MWTYTDSESIKFTLQDFIQAINQRAPVACNVEEGVYFL